MNVSTASWVRVAESEPAPRPPGAAVDAAGISDLGKIRSRNEDAFLIASLHRSLLLHDASALPAHLARNVPSALVLAVADGLGGYEGGGIASQTAIAAVASYFLSDLPWPAPRPSAQLSPNDSLLGLRSELGNLVVAADAEVRLAAEEHAFPHMGSTLTLAYVIGLRLYLAHAGDSRCYLWRGDELSRLTKDHTHAEQMLERGELEAARTSPASHLLWNSLGGSSSGVVPEVTRIQLEPDDVLLLATDGLTNHVADARIALVLGARQSAADACRELVDEANSRGGSDNITVVVARGFEASPGYCEST